MIAQRMFLATTRPAILAILAATICPLASAQILEEVIVTAQKRAQSINDVPIAISAFSQQQMELANTHDVSSLISYVPGVSGFSSGVASNSWRIRGIGTNDWSVSSEPAVGVYLDDAYVGRNITSTTSFFDLERIEIIKGPQGTLFGRNASAGAISMVTNKPGDENFLKLGIGFGNEGQQHREVVANLALSDSVAFRLAYQGNEYDGIRKNVFNGEDQFLENNSIRLMGRFNPTDAVEILVSGHYTELDSNSVRWHSPDLAAALGLPGGGDPTSDEITSDSLNLEDIEGAGANLRISWDIGDKLTLVSISDWRDWEYLYASDTDGIGVFFPIEFVPALIVADGPAAFIQDPQNGDTLSQEFRLNGSTESLQWFVGASWFEEDVNQTNSFTWPVTIDYDGLAGLPPGTIGTFTVSTPANPSQQIMSGDYESWGVYGDVAWAVSESVTLTGGIRYSSDKKDFCAADVDPSGFLAFLGPDTGGATICDSQSWDEVTPRLVVDYTWAENMLFYASYAKGYKGGGFNSTVAGSGVDGLAPPFSLQSFEPETSDAYELGMKATLLDGTLQFNASLYRTNYQDLQLLVQDLQIFITNLDGVDVTGSELELNYATPIEGLTLNGYYAYIDSEIEAPGSSIDGSVMAQAPEHSFGIAGTYEHPFGEYGELIWFLGYNWQDDQIFDITVTRYPQDSFGLLDAAVTFAHHSGRWDLSLAGQNLTDEKYVIFAADILGFGAAVNVGLSMMYMLNFNFYFGGE